MAREEKRSFRYRERSKEDVKERANARGGGFDSIVKNQYKIFKPRDGKNLIRVLPPTWADAKHYGYDVFVNYGIGADNQAYLSLSKHGKGDDPLADARRQAEKDGDDKTAKALRPNQRVGVWLIDRLDEDEGPQFWTMPFTVDKDMSNACFDEDTKEVIFIDDPENGCDFRFYKEGTGLKTKYPGSKMKVLKESPLHEDEKVQAEWLEYITDNPIPDCLQFYDADHISSVFGGSVRTNSDDDDEDGDRRARRRSSRDDDGDEKPRSRRQAASDDEEKPASRRRRDSEDDGEEEKPARRRAARDEPEEEKPRGRRRVDEDEPPFDEDEKPSRRRAEPEEKAEGKPSRQRGRIQNEDEPDEDEKPRKRRDPEDEGTETVGSRIRDRLKRNAQASSKTNDDED